MENKINISFIKEEKNIEIDIQQPDLSNLVHKIIAEHLLVSETNIKISTDNDNFDKEEFLQMLIEVHQDFCEEIDKFYENIDKEMIVLISETFGGHKMKNTSYKNKQFVLLGMTFLSVAGIAGCSKVELAQSSVTLELGDELSENVADYLQNPDEKILKDASLDLSAVDETKVGSYNAAVAYDGKKLSVYGRGEGHDFTAMRSKRLYLHAAGNADRG